MAPPLRCCKVRPWAEVPPCPRPPHELLAGRWGVNLAAREETCWASLLDA